MPRVDVRTLSDPILFRLHLVAREMLEEGDGTEQTNWAQVVRVTFVEISRRGFSPSDILITGHRRSRRTRARAQGFPG
jgi:hypothetical protein